MTAADKIEEARKVRRFKLVSEDGWHGMTVRPDGGYVSHKDYAALADLADAQAQDGWLYHCPDSGLEWSEDHPHESGQCTDATDVRPATVENLKATLLDSWEAWAEDRERADAQAQEIARLRGCFERIEKAALHGCLTPELVAQITRAALGETP